MKHRHHSKRIAHFKKKYKHLAAAFAGAMILSSALLPGIPIATAHAAANPNVGNTRTTTTRTPSANRAGSAAGLNANDSPGVTSRPNLSGNETGKPASPNVTAQPSSSEKAPTTPEVQKVNEEKAPTTPEVQKVNEEKAPTTPEATKVNEEKAPTTPEATKVNEEKTPTTAETPKVSEEKTPTAPAAPKVSQDKTPTGSSLPSEGGSAINPVERSTNPNQDTVAATPKVSEDKTPTGSSLPSEGGSAVNPVERSTNPNQDTVAATPKVSEDKTSTGSALPSEGGNVVNPVERNTNPNQDTVNTPLPSAKGNVSEAAPGDVPANYKEVLNITATAYSPGPLDNDQWGDKTRMGTTIRPGVIAVDPKVIPLGSKVYVQYPDGHGEYKVAEDTGGAIKGNRIDIALMDRGNAKDFGIQPVKVYVVETPKDT